MRTRVFAICLVTLLAAVPIVALLGETPTIRAVAFIDPKIDGLIDPKTDGLVLIGEVPTHQLIGEVPTIQLIGEVPTIILRAVDKATGALAAPDQVAPLPVDATAVDVIFSNVFLSNSILVLLDDLRILEYPVAFDSQGQAKLIGDTPTIHGPFGDPPLVGAATVLAEAASAIDPKIDSFVGIGTDAGNVIVVSLIEPKTDGVVALGKGAVTGLTTVPQVGYFAFVAAHNGRAVGVNPNGTPSIVFDLADPRPDPLLDLSTGVIDPKTDDLTDPAPVAFVAANGTRDVAVLEIPADPGFGGMLAVRVVDPKIDGIVRVELGSLVALTQSGAALYDPGFTLAAGGSGTTFTIAGATADLDPDTLNLWSSGRYVTATIEVENGGAASIDPSTLALRYADLSVPSSLAFPPQIGDVDGDGQADVLAKFDRDAVEAMLGGVPSGATTLKVTWLFTDGSPGSATGVIRLLNP